MMPMTRLTSAAIAICALWVCVMEHASADAGAPDPSGIAGLQPWQFKEGGIGKMPLSGGLSTTDLTTFRMYYPSTLKVDRTPHYHLGTEHVIVLKGTIYLGFGSCLEPSKAVAYGPGSFMSIPAGTPHFEWFEGEVVIQVTSVGPMNTVPIPDGCKRASSK